MSANAIKAGEAFVRMFMHDEDVRRSLENVKVQLRAFGTTVDQVGTQSFTAMNTGAVAATASTAASVGALTAVCIALRNVIFSIAGVAKSVFAVITGSVITATLSLRGLSQIINRFLPGTGLSRIFNGFLNRSQSTELIGRWTRFAGAITGSKLLTDLGNRVERAGLGASIVAGMQKGVVPGITAAVGAGLRSARSMLLSQAGALLTLPVRALRGTVGGTVGIVAPKAGAAIAGQRELSGGMFAAAGSANILKAASGGVTSALSRLAMVALKVGGISALLTGPALASAKSFVAAAHEITAAARESGESIDALIAKKYGKASFITPADIAAGNALAETMTELKQAVSAAWAQIGIAALPVLKRTTEFLRDAAQAVTRFLVNNRELIAQAVSIAARIGAVAGAVAGLYGAWIVLAPVVAALASPLGLVAVALAGVLYFFPQLREAAADCFSFLFPNFNELLSIVSGTLQGIMDALVAGDIAAAGRVLWAGLEVAWLAGTERLREIYRNAVNNLAAVGVDLFASLRTGWVVTTQFLGDAWEVVVRGIVATWTTAQNTLAGGFARVIAKLTGQDVNEVLQSLREMQEQERGAGQQKYAEENQQRAQLAAKRLLDIERERKEQHETLAEMKSEQEQAAQASLDAARKEFADAQAAAAAARKKLVGPSITAAAAKGQEFAATLGSFSAAGLGRQAISGLSPLQDAMDKTADNTGKLVDLMENQKRLEFA